MRIFRNLAVVTATLMTVAACHLDRDDPLVFGTRLPQPAADQGQAQTQAAAPAQPPQQAPLPPMTMNEIAVAYVKLVLSLGELDEGYVDAYYGPPEWRDEVKAKKLDAAKIESESQRLIVRLIATAPEALPSDPELAALRKSYLKNQLGALSARAAMLQGRKFSFDDEARALYDVEAPHYAESDFQPALKQLDALLPKEAGTLAQRYNRYIDRYAVPKDKLQSVMRAAIGYAQLHVRGHLELPQGERFELALVGDKPWSAYNWYQGNFYSRIEVNAEQPVSISRVIQLASHEGYPGHHVYNSLLEKDLVRGQGWPEYQVYPLYSPQSFIAEGSADFGVELTFPEAQRLNFERELFDLAGFDASQVETYDRVTRAAKALNPAAIEAARRYLDGRMDADSAANWLQIYALASPERAHQRIAFFDHYRSYIINYSYGEELIRNYVEAKGGRDAGSDAQWHAFIRLLSSPRVATELN
ncbi:hypothetical protein [Nevskia soli]|uniref:hypothetical protein n=1 Tax=Nevskia soli TaxID=418856 RepID=UPI0012F923F6|nr:hypothetical protein [Nevskia soli]